MHDDFNENVWLDPSGDILINDPAIGALHCPGFCDDGWVKACGHNSECEECDRAYCPVCAGTGLPGVRLATEREIADYILYELHGCTDGRQYARFGQEVA